jgi:hypothetical protein
LVKGQVVGELRVGFDAETLLERPLIVLEPVREGSLWQRATDSVRLLFQ